MASEADAGTNALEAVVSRRLFRAQCASSVLVLGVSVQRGVALVLGSDMTGYVDICLCRVLTTRTVVGTLGGVSSTDVR